MVSMVLPLLHGASNARGGSSSNPALEGHSTTYRTNQTILCAGRSELPTATAAGGVTLGVRQPADLTIVNMRGAEAGPWPGGRRARLFPNRWLSALPRVSQS